MNLPPTQPAMIWYPYSASSQFPELGIGGRTIMAGPVYHFDPELDSTIKLPAYYDDTLFIYEWSRNWVKEVKLDAQGNILKINPFAPNVPLVRPMDMELGPDGALYVLEWGTAFNGNNANAQLVRIEFLGTPQIVSADFDESEAVDGADFLNWQRGFGMPGAAERENGDADVNGRVDEADFGIWAEAFGGGSGLAAVQTAAGAAALTAAGTATEAEPWAAALASARTEPMRSLGPDSYFNLLARERDLKMNASHRTTNGGPASVTPHRNNEPVKRIGARDAVEAGNHSEPADSWNVSVVDCALSDLL
jgi:hypothetical protein